MAVLLEKVTNFHTVRVGKPCSFFSLSCPRYVFFIIFALFLLTFLFYLLQFLWKYKTFFDRAEAAEWASWKVRDFFFQLCCALIITMPPHSPGLQRRKRSVLPSHCQHVNTQDWAEAPQMGKLKGASSLFFDCACAYHSHSKSPGLQGRMPSPTPSH